jgi:cellulose synthase/poly-beta-1,6-N-acetylglucosamine synthase-like glycosyltransferase
VDPTSGGVPEGGAASAAITGRRLDDELSRARLVAETWISGVAIVLTVLALAAFLITFGQALRVHQPGIPGLIAAAAYLMIVTFLAAGGIVYLASRLGYMRRRARFRHATTDELRRFAGETNALVTILIPSYKEEPGVVRQTVLSAVLQEFPQRRVVLLIDDPPDPVSAEDARRLEAVRKLPEEIGALLAELRGPYAWAAWRADRAALRGQLDRREATEELVELYWSAATWFWSEAVTYEPGDHSGALR